jgi:hypothetical protein
MRIMIGIALILSVSSASYSLATVNNEYCPINRSTFQNEAHSSGYCCKVCHKGKACGDSCISVEKECHQPTGCACDV